LVIRDVSLYLGLDCSTQSLSAIILAVDGADRRIVLEREVVFDRDLPAYGTRHGVLPSDDPLVAHSPPLMWAEALDRLLGDLAASGIDRGAIRAIAGSAQQHGSVYLNATFGPWLAQLDPDRPLADQLPRVFTRDTAPIWMDASTTEECAEISHAMGGAARLASLTGSRAFERFTGPQIRKFWKRAPDAYARTRRIDMVSSFMASLLAGAPAPLDPGDASGMNLMALATSRWLPEALDATAPDLDARLPSIVPPDTIAGGLSSYWQARHGLPPARVVVWTGDNPSSLVGTGLIDEGRVSVSLGTSDTVFGPMREPRVDPSGTGHVFGAPIGGFMGLTCFRNGSLARERIRDTYGLDWRGFSAALAATPPGNGGALMLPWFEPEITPPVAAPGVRRLHLDDADAAANVRAVVEAQMLAMATHSSWMGGRVRAMHATGGASANREILQVMADVFGAEVYQFRVTNAACLGAALRAWHADAAASGAPIQWRDVVRGLAEPVAASRVAPRPETAALYEERRRAYAELERQALDRPLSHD
jgi:xylulokinase